MAKLDTASFARGRKAAISDRDLGLAPRATAALTEHNGVDAGSFLAGYRDMVKMSRARGMW